MCNTQDVVVDHFTFSRNIFLVSYLRYLSFFFIHFKSNSNLKPQAHVPVAIKTSRSR